MLKKRETEKVGKNGNSEDGMNAVNGVHLNGLLSREREHSSVRKNSKAAPERSEAGTGLPSVPSPYCTG